MENNTCQVCNHVLNKPKFMAMWDGPYDTIECEICGKYYINNEALSMLSTFKEKTKLSAWIRDLHERGVESPKINEFGLAISKKACRVTLPVKNN